MSSPQHEPTMEEILASIRKIISEDSPADAAPAVEVQPVAAAAPAHAEPDVLELTQEVIETSAHQPAPVMPVAADDIMFENSLPAAPAPSNDIFSDQDPQGAG